MVGQEWVDSGKPARPSMYYRDKNGNLPDEELTKIMNDIHGNEERLSNSAAKAFNKMVLDAKKDGVVIKITDAYRICGSPGDNQKGIWSQWAAREKELLGGNSAADPDPNTGVEWIKNRGGKCTSNHGWGNAIDISGSAAIGWVKNKSN